MNHVIGVVNLRFFGLYTDPAKLAGSEDVKFIRVSIARDAPDSEIREKLGEVDVVIAAATLIYNKRVFRLLPRLKAVVRWGVGYDNLVLEDATEEGVIASRLPSIVLKDSVAQMAVALLLTALRKVHKADEYVRRGGWASRDIEGLKALVSPSIEDLAIGIIGLGNIGFRVFELLKPFKPKKIFVYDPYIPPSLIRSVGGEPVSSLDELLKFSDVITIHAPLTEETRHMIGRREFSKMKRGVYLINTARGAIVDTDALVWALKEGIVEFAALDVFDPEPIPPDHPILQFDNVILTPHIASGTTKSFSLMDEYSIAEAMRILKGEKPLWILNPEVLKSPKLRAKIRT